MEHYLVATLLSKEQRNSATEALKKLPQGAQPQRKKFGVIFCVTTSMPIDEQNRLGITPFSGK